MKLIARPARGDEWVRDCEISQSVMDKNKTPSDPSGGAKPLLANNPPKWAFECALFRVVCSHHQLPNGEPFWNTRIDPLRVRQTNVLLHAFIFLPRYIIILFMFRLPNGR